MVFDNNAKEAEGKDMQHSDTTSNDLWSRNERAKENRSQEAGMNRDTTVQMNNGYNTWRSSKK